MESENKCDHEQRTASTTSSKFLNSCLENIKFKWSTDIPQFGGKLLLRLNEFRKKNVLCDVSLKTQDDELKAHRIVLAACGGIFRAQFENDTEILVPEIFVDCPTVGLEEILNFAYTGHLEIDTENLFAVFVTAHHIKMKEIEEICSNISISKFSWLLLFDGTKDTLPKMLKPGSEDDSMYPTTLDDAFGVLHYILEANLKNFKEENNSSSNSSSENTFPCFTVVAEKWPKLKNAYSKVMWCLKRAESLMLPSTKATSKLAKNHNEEMKKTPETKSINENGNNPVSTNHDEPDKVRRLVPSSSKLVKTEVETFSNQRQNSKSESSSLPVARPHSRSSPTCTVLSQQPPSTSPTPARRRNNTTKHPPAVPPQPVFKQNSKPMKSHAQENNHLNTKQENVKSQTKIPPPRPRPPTIIKKKKEETSSAQ